jgi:uncharacterized membrane protein
MNTYAILSVILSLVLFLWLIILAVFTFKSQTEDSPLKKYALATFVVGTLATILEVIFITYI